MRQRVAFARTLLAGRAVLLLDEPFASLDAITRADLQDWLRGDARARSARTTVLVTHDVEEALYLGRPRASSSPRARGASSGRPPPRRAARGGRPRSRGQRARSSSRSATWPSDAARGGDADVRGRAFAVLAPLALIAALIAAWQIAADTGALADLLGLESFLVPAPSEIADGALGQPRAARRQRLGDAAGGPAGLRRRAGRWASGFAVGASPLRRCCGARSTRSLVASQTIPILVVAPILVVWFGFGIGPKIAIVALICFFPIAVNTLDGLSPSPRRSRGS